MTITLDWGDRSERLRVLHKALGGKKSFLLEKAPLPVALGGLTASQVAGWDTAPVTPIPITPLAGTFTATTALPVGTAFVRLDFDLVVTIDSATASCLEFRQLFRVGPGDVLMPSQYSFQDHGFKASSSAGSTAPSPVRPAGRRVVLGVCPLLTVSATGVMVNCEFLDVTELWWATWASAERWGWLLDREFKGRPDALRVLAWTSGCAPMLWFTALSAKAEVGGQDQARSGADIVFFRAQAGFNSFRYDPDEKGFSHPQHADTTMFHLGRWLLDALPEVEVSALLNKTRPTGKPFGVGYAGVRLRPKTMPPPSIVPSDPMDCVPDDVRWAFRPAGVHNALSREGNADIAFLPLGFDGGDAKDRYTAGGGYTALLKRGALGEVMASARRLLWMRGALSRMEESTPTFDRQIWLVANSAANRQLFTCLMGNIADVDRIVSLDATKAGEVLIPMGVPAIQAAGAARTKAGKKFKAVVVTTPNMWSTKTAYLDIESKLRATNADVVMLPPTVEFDAYWQHPPTATSNPLMFEALKFWDGYGLSASKRMGSPPPSAQWLWWHEWSVHGGHFDPALSPPAGTAGPTPTPRIKTFFEDALGL